MPTAAVDSSKMAGKVTQIVFFALILDLLAFTIPLPLFPRLIAWYTEREAHDSSKLLSRLLELSRSWRSSLLDIAAPSAHAGARPVDNKNWDVVLLGGAMGSLFSFCQFLISPWIGSLSDRYGRKPVLLSSMIGNILSAAVWLKSTTFSSFLWSRLIGGLSEGNIQISQAIISDVTTPETRSKSLALIGIAFSICFTFGPSIGAYFASKPLPVSTSSHTDWNVYALPAAITLVLLLVETLYLISSLPETKGFRPAPANVKGDGVVVKDAAVERVKRLNSIGGLHGMFLLFFSGAEFTLTFLTYDLYAATNAQNGKLLSYIGILAALLQGGFVRRVLARVGEVRMAASGVLTCNMALLVLAFLPYESIRASDQLSTLLLYTAATGLAYTSATVVTSLSAAAAACCDDETGTDPRLQRGRALGAWRSKGQLGRAVGPLLASAIYWVRGPTTCYVVLAAAMSLVMLSASGLAEAETARRSKAKAKTQ